jgi:hypothetical protein
MPTSRTRAGSQDTVRPPLSALALVAQLRKKVLADARLLSSIYGLSGSEIDVAEERAGVLFLENVSNPSAAVLNAVDETCIRFDKPSIRSPGIPIDRGSPQRLVLDGELFRLTGPQPSKRNNEPGKAAVL